MTDDPLARAFAFQSAACAQFGSTFYASLTQLVADDPDDGVWALFAPWDGQSFEDLAGHLAGGGASLAGGVVEDDPGEP